ncbi:hypothetical protein PVAG01_03012 [Phlyctema vagabunda]|uniref:Uncharacterized protein n=1 Tax=Phlyctema vagabunda TaxID=108571 RepID=A0ABR4PSI0_9HELO
MPPNRNMPPAKVVKTERTHEENQERAYIAASRRSDRSLEARIESARRASDIHKKRTGRGLRVTEADVQNEEMYEEEEDDLPYPYRRLTSHLETGSQAFNSKLSAYLTNHVAMRSALEHSIRDSYQLQSGGNTQFSYNPQTMFPSPMLAHQPQYQARNPYVQHQQPNSPSFRQSPYPQPNGFQSQHHRAASISVPAPGVTASPITSPIMLTSEQRRMSTSAINSTSQTPTTPTANTPGQTTQMKQRPAFAQGSFSQLNINHPSMPQQIPNHPNPQPMGMQSKIAISEEDIFPLTTQPSMETSMFFGAGFPSNFCDPMSQDIMGGGDKFSQQPIFNYGNFQMPQTGNPLKMDSQNFHLPNGNGNIKSENQYGGLNSTLAPFDSEQIQEMPEPDFFKEAAGLATNEETPCVTPGNGEAWTNFINDDWQEASLPSSQTSN